MAEPTTEFRTFTNSAATTEVDTPGERTGGAITGENAVLATGDPLDLGIVDISGGTNDSSIQNMLWRVSANGGNTLAEDFGIWQLTPSQEGFDQAGTLLKVQHLMGADGTPAGNQEEYVSSAGIGSYSNWTTIPTTEGAEFTLLDSLGNTSVDITTPGTSDDAIFWAHYLVVAASETTGTYEDLTSGFEFQASYGYSYS